MFKDDDMFPMPLSYRQEQVENEVTDAQPQYANDDFDDIFGSEPPSPTLQSHTLSQDQQRGNSEPSDIPRIKEKHTTEGYRDGVTQGKGKSVQVGFDEGYSLGAILGLRIGKILGLLEGILGGVDGEEKTRVEGLLNQAKKELSTQTIFGTEFWGEDGIWKFEVVEHKGKEVLFPDVAAAHPLIQKWEKVVKEEVEKWGIDLGIFDTEDRAVDGEEGEASAKQIREGMYTKVAGGKEVAAEPVVGGGGKIMGVAKKDLNW